MSKALLQSFGAVTGASSPGWHGPGWWCEPPSSTGLLARPSGGPQRACASRREPRRPARPRVRLRSRSRGGGGQGPGSRGLARDVPRDDSAPRLLRAPDGAPGLAPPPVNMQRVTGRDEGEAWIEESQRRAPWSYGAAFDPTQLPPTLRLLADRVASGTLTSVRRGRGGGGRSKPKRGGAGAVAGRAPAAFATRRLHQPVVLLTGDVVARSSALLRDVTINLRGHGFFRLDPHLDPANDGANVRPLSARRAETALRRRSRMVCSGASLAAAALSSGVHPWLPVADSGHPDARRTARRAHGPAKGRAKT